MTGKRRKCRKNDVGIANTRLAFPSRNLRHAQVVSILPTHDFGHDVGMTSFQILVGSAYEPGHFGESEVWIAIFNRLEKPPVRLDLIIALTFRIGYPNFRRIRDVVKRTDQDPIKGLPDAQASRS